MFSSWMRYFRKDSSAKTLNAKLTKLASETAIAKDKTIKIVRHVPRHLIGQFKGRGWKTVKAKGAINIMTRSFKV